MNTFDLKDYGFPGKAFCYHGKIERECKEGDKLLFLFKETHRIPSIIRPNVENALNLIDQDIIACVGVEEYPFVYADKTNEQMQELKAKAFLSFGTEKGVLDNLGPSYFGQAVRLLRPSNTVACVEDPLLYEVAAQRDEEYRSKMEDLQSQFYKELAKAKSPDWNSLPSAEQHALAKLAEEKAIEQIELEYGNDSANTNRDRPFFENLMKLWGNANFANAAILNGGSKHIDRIVPMLKCRFIQISQS